MKKILLLSLRKQMHGDAFWFGFQESFISATAMAMVLYVKVGCLWGKRESFGKGFSFFNIQRDIEWKIMREKSLF